MGAWKKKLHNEHWEFVRKIFRQVYLVRSFAKIPNRIQAKIDINATAMARMLEDSRRRQHLFLKKILVEEAFIGKTLGIDRWGMCIQHPNQPICKFSKFDSAAIGKEKLPPVVHTCRMCGLLEAGQDVFRPAMVTIIGEIRELESNRKEWKETTVKMGNKKPNRQIIRLNSEDDDYPGSSDIDSDQTDDYELGFENNNIVTKAEWIEFARLRIRQVHSWEDRFALKNHPVFCHYFKKLRSGVSIDTVKFVVKSQGYHPSIADLEPDLPLEHQVENLDADALGNLHSKGILISEREKLDDSLALYCRDGSMEVDVEETLKTLLSVNRRGRFTKLFAISAILDANEYAPRQEKNKSLQKIISKTPNRKGREDSRNQHTSRTSTNPSKGHKNRRSSEACLKRNPGTSMRRKSEPSIRRRSDPSANRSLETSENKSIEPTVKRRSKTPEKRNSGTSENMDSSVGTDVSGQKDSHNHEPHQRKRKLKSAKPKGPERLSSQRTGSTVDTSGHENPWSERTSRTMNTSKSEHNDGESKSRRVQSPSPEHQVRRKLKASHSPDSKHKKIVDKSTDRKHSKSHRYLRRNSIVKHSMDRKGSEKEPHVDRTETTSSNKKTIPDATSVLQGAKMPSPKHEKGKVNNIRIPDSEDGGNQFESATNDRRDPISPTKKNPTDIATECGVVLPKDMKKNNDQIAGATSSPKKTFQAITSLFQGSKNDVPIPAADKEKQKNDSTCPTTKGGDGSNKTSSSKKRLSATDLPQAFKNAITKHLDDKVKKKSDSAVSAAKEGSTIREGDNRNTTSSTKQISTPAVPLPEDTTNTLDRILDEEKQKDDSTIPTTKDGDSRNTTIKSRTSTAENEVDSTFITSPLSTSKKKKLQSFFGKAIKVIRRPSKSPGPLLRTKPRNEIQSRDKKDHPDDPEPNTEPKPEDSNNTPCSPAVSKSIYSNSIEPVSTPKKNSPLVRVKPSAPITTEKSKCTESGGKSNCNTRDASAIANHEAQDATLEDSDSKTTQENNSSVKNEKIQDMREYVRTKEQTINDLLRQELKRKDGIINDLRRQIKEMNENVEKRRGSFKSRKNRQSKATAHDSIDPLILSERSAASMISSKRDISHKSAPEHLNINKKNNPISDSPRAGKGKKTPHSKRNSRTKRDDSRKRRSASRSMGTSIGTVPSTVEVDKMGPNPGELEEGLDYELVLLDCIQNLRDIEGLESSDDGGYASGYEFNWNA